MAAVKRCVADPQPRDIGTASGVYRVNQGTFDKVHHVRLAHRANKAVAIIMIARWFGFVAQSDVMSGARPAYRRSDSGI